MNTTIKILVVVSLVLNFFLFYNLEETNIKQSNMQDVIRIQSVVIKAHSRSILMLNQRVYTLENNEIK